MNNRSRRIYLTACLLFPLIGCQALPSESIRHEGRFNLLAKTPHGIENWTGRFVWIHAQNFNRLDLLTPLSGILLRIEQTREEATIQRGIKEPPITGSNLNTLLTQELGFTIPLASFEALLSGHTKLDDDFSEEHWRIRVLLRDETGNPKRLRFDHLIEPAVTVTIFLETSA